MNSHAVSCSQCDSPKIRRATLRLADVMHLIRFKYPIRCRACRERRYIEIWKALRLERPPGRRARIIG